MRRRKGKPSRNQLELFPRAAEPVGIPTLLSRATAKRGASARNVEAPAPKPWACAVLAVDTAKRSGYAVWSRGVYQWSSEVDTLDEATLELIVENAIGHARSEALPIVLVLEAPFGGSVNVVSSLGVARERWLRAWRNAGESIGRVVKVQPSTWRAAVLGASSVSLERDLIRRVELEAAKRLVVAKGMGAPMPIGSDEAPAILIGRWASHAGSVGRCIGKRAVRASVAEWMRPIRGGR